MASNTIYPAIAFINAITNAQKAVVTFVSDHDFTLGEIVSFRVGRKFGMREINNQRGVVLSSTSDTITVDIDSSSWTSFDYSLLNTASTTPPVCLPSSSSVIPGSNPAKINNSAAFDNRRS